uniref:U2266s n=1 Tax=Mycobacterium leprae TaxID=1769 RepID=Q50054_MYCLR|nr:u2266s [Mycobacterium leprae]
MNPTILAGYVENRPQQPKRGEFSSRADSEGVDELLYALAADFVGRLGVSNAGCNHSTSWATRLGVLTRCIWVQI